MRPKGKTRFLSKTWAKITLVAIGAITLSAVTVGSVFAWLFVPWVAATAYSPPADAIEAYQQDLQALQAYANYEKAFDDPSKRAAFLARVAEIEQDLSNMSAERFELAVAGAVALGDNGHSNVSPIGRTRRVNHFPIRSGPFEDGEYVVQATRDLADLLGAQIIAVEGNPIAKVVDSFLPYFGGVERRSRFFAHLFIMSPALLHAQGYTASPDEAVLTLRLSSGEIIDRRLAGVMPTEGQRQPFGREVMDYRTPASDGNRWVHLMQDKPAPLYLAEPDEPYLYQYLEQHHGAYIKINFNADVGGRSLVAWLEGVAADLETRRPRLAIIDLRFNGGGTDATSAFAERLPSLVQGNGPIYVLTSRETFSAALGAATQFKLAAGGRTRVVGGLVGDRLRFIGNGGKPYVLPNSGITLNIWSTWEDYRDGCWEWTECFWLSPFFRTAGVESLKPDIPAKLNFRDYVRGVDAALVAALEDATDKGYLAGAGPG